jgi:hypothetical protein
MRLFPALARERRQSHSDDNLKSEPAEQLAKPIDELAPQAASVPQAYL